METQTKSDRIASLTKTMRSCGTIVLTAAAISFLVQRWDTSTHILRYLYFLGFTCLLAFSGYLCGIRLKETKGARTFLGITAGLAVVHFCQLGAFLYSSYGLQLGQVPRFLQWQTTDTLSLLGTIGLGLSIMIPLSFVGFSALFREAAKPISLLYLSECALLLLPTRESRLIGVLGLACLIANILFDKFKLRKLTASKTTEADIVRALLLLPGIVLFSRNLFLYNFYNSYCFSGLAYLSLSILLFNYVPQRYESSKALSCFAQRLSILTTAAACVYMHLSFYPKGAQSAFELSTLCLPFAMILVAASFFSEREIRTELRYAGTFIASLAACYSLLVFGGIIASVQAVIISVGLILFGHEVKSARIFRTGMASLAISLLYHLRYAQDLFEFSPWLSLGVTGVIVILGASYLERYHVQLHAAVKKLSAHFKTDEMTTEGACIYLEKSSLETPLVIKKDFIS